MDRSAVERVRSRSLHDRYGIKKADYEDKKTSSKRIWQLLRDDGFRFDSD